MSLHKNSWLVPIVAWGLAITAPAGAQPASEESPPMHVAFEDREAGASIPPTEQSMAQSDQARPHQEPMSARNESPANPSVWPFIAASSVVLLLTAAALTSGRRRPPKAPSMSNESADS